MRWFIITAKPYFNENREFPWCQLCRHCWHRRLLWQTSVPSVSIKLAWRWLRLSFDACDDLDISLQWRHNGRDSVSNHQPHNCLLNRLFRRRSKKTSKVRVTGLCVGNSPGTGEFPAQMASNAVNVSISWRHHVWHDDDTGFHLMHVIIWTYDFLSKQCIHAVVHHIIEAIWTVMYVISLVSLLVAKLNQLVILVLYSETINRFKVQSFRGNIII